ncbi:MAG: DUF1508 domain-containing protein, partial [Gammaproteobacteria bacterium]|nr:DUF1508 domain-containing protein [Gammaproteobacteria bacterium]
PARFEIYRTPDDDTQPWRWRLLDGNNENIADGGEGFASKNNVLESVKNLCEEVCKNTPIVREGSAEDSSDHTRFALYERTDNKYDFRIQNKGNNKIIGISRQGYESMQGVERGAENVRGEISDAPPITYENPSD